MVIYRIQAYCGPYKYTKFKTRLKAYPVNITLENVHSALFRESPLQKISFSDPEAKTFLPMWDQSAEASKKRKVSHGTYFP